LLHLIIDTGFDLLDLLLQHTLLFLGLRLRERQELLYDEALLGVLHGLEAILQEHAQVGDVLTEREVSDQRSHDLNRILEQEITVLLALDLIAYDLMEVGE
jgi:hypothetical protein